MLSGLELPKLVNLLNPICRRGLESAAAICVERNSDQVSHQHLLLGLLDQRANDIDCILSETGIQPDRLAADIRRHAKGSKRQSDGRPVFAPALIALLQDAWLIASVELQEPSVRSGAILLALLANPMRWGDDAALSRLDALSQTDIKARFSAMTAASRESAAAPAKDGGAIAPHAVPDGALERYTVNFTRKARDGQIDPVFCRDREIRQIIDILGRRRKNNPICIGEAGVGKTAVVEGLALRIVHGDVPDFLSAVEVHGLDMGLLQAGASVKGEFENRLKAVITEINASVRPIVLFVDEAHTLIGAGGPQGGSDAANLLKPVLARGELRTIAATTWTEYKKYFEKDPALARRFQRVTIDEPSPANAAVILRGLRPAYEKAHGVYIRDDAVKAAGNLSARYLSGRQLPDKAIDVLDTACARVRLTLTGKPKPVDDLERRIATLERERDAYARDRQFGVPADGDRIAAVAGALDAARSELEAITLRWAQERRLVDRILAVRQSLHTEEVAAMERAPAPSDDTDAAPNPAEADPDSPHVDTVPQPDPADADPLATLAQVQAELDTLTQGHPLVHFEVCPETIGAVIADWTGIPLGRMVRDESALLRRLDDALQARIRGQDEALSVIHKGILTAKANLGNPASPMGVFLLAGPSGVGKTETALALADLLFGGDRFMITVNMSEFQEKHSVARLIGSPPGYVGYGEGGVLTEAVRQRPYSVVLLDEIEKADPEVMNLFYQVFDKGTLADGEGREIDFRNTVILMTTNLGAADIVALTDRGITARTALLDAIRPTLTAWLKPALVARMTVVPYLPLHGTIMDDVARLKLDRVGDRLKDRHGMAFRYTDAVVAAVIARCTDVETGARAIDHILNDGLSPQLATDLLTRLGTGALPGCVTVDIGADGAFSLRFDEDDAPESGGPDDGETGGTAREGIHPMGPRATVDA